MQPRLNGAVVTDIIGRVQHLGRHLFLCYPHLGLLFPSRDTALALQLQGRGSGGNIVVDQLPIATIIRALPVQHYGMATSAGVEGELDQSLPHRTNMHICPLVHPRQACTRQVEDGPWPASNLPGSTAQHLASSTQPMASSVSAMSSLRCGPIRATSLDHVNMDVNSRAGAGGAQGRSICRGGYRRAQLAGSRSQRAGTSGFTGGPMCRARPESLAREYQPQTRPDDGAD